MEQEKSNEQSEEKPAARFWWMTNSKGEPSSTLTFVSVSFFIVTLSYILSMFQKIGPIEFRTFDASACTAYFLPIAALYFGRRWADSTNRQPPQ